MLLNAQEDERRRVAFELHDGLGQNLSVLKLQIGSIKKKLSKDQSLLQEICETVLLELNDTIDEVRRISSDLCPSILVDLGLCSALRWLVNRFSDNSKVKVSMDIPDTVNEFSQARQIAVYRIFQEILTNIEKHSHANLASVECEMKTQTAVFRVEDNGNGFDVEQIQARPAFKKGLGLTSMEERVKMLDGNFKILSREGRGTKIFFEIPIADSG
jgi:signal transduction histidine kinase